MPASHALRLVTRGSYEMTATSSKGSRLPALDFTKGALVLIMVLYHWLNYFFGPTDNRYLRFLTPSFIFISGFLISNIYLSKYGISDPHLPKRLIQRGLKVFGVFVLLNVTRILLVRGNFPSQAPSIDSPIRSPLTFTSWVAELVAVRRRRSPSSFCSPLATCLSCRQFS